MSDTPVSTPAPAPAEETKTTTTTVTNEKKSNTGLKVILIIGAVLLCLCVICSVAGYLVYQSTLNASQGLLNAISNEIQNQTNNDLFNTNPESDEVDPNDTPETDMPTGNDGDYGFGELPEGFPNDIPIPNDAEIALAGSSTQDGELIYSASLTSKASVSELVNFYESGLSDLGWTITMNQSYAASGTVIVAEKSGREANIVISGETGENVSAVILTVQ